MTQPRIPARLLTAIGAAIAALALLAPAASASEPNPGYSQFAGCPDEAVVFFCYTTEINGGHFQMGTKDVPIEKPMTISGGVSAVTFKSAFSAKGGLTKVAQKVPGGVIGLTGLTWLLELFGSEALTLYATTELAGTVGFPIEEDPLALPIKVHLTNPAGLLGNNCYVGSTSNPIALGLTFGTTKPPAPNKPITGQAPTKVTFDPKTQIVTATDGIFVDNSFAAPGASGCVLTLFGFIPVSINGLVNSQSGLPAAAGTNETVQEVDSQFVESAPVYP
jgi:hypothetical protein